MEFLQISHQKKEQIRATGSWDILVILWSRIMLAEALTKFTCGFSEGSECITSGSFFITHYSANNFLGPCEIFDFLTSVYVKIKMPACHYLQ